MNRNAAIVAGALATPVLLGAGIAEAQFFEGATRNTAVVKVACDKSVVVIVHKQHPSMPRARMDRDRPTFPNGAKRIRYKQYTGDIRFDLEGGRCRTPENIGPAGPACRETFRTFDLGTFIARPGRGGKRNNSGAITFDPDESHCWLRVRVRAVFKWWRNSEAHPRRITVSTGLFGNNRTLHVRGSSPLIFDRPGDVARYKVFTTLGSGWRYETNWKPWAPKGRIATFSIRSTVGAVRGGNVRRGRPAARGGRVRRP